MYFFSTLSLLIALLLSGSVLSRTVSPSSAESDEALGLLLAARTDGDGGASAVDAFTALQAAAQKAQLSSLESTALGTPGNNSSCQLYNVQKRRDW